jgi:hypothetical protein
MNKLAMTLTVLGLLAATGCKSDDSANNKYEVMDTAVATPVTFDITGMT